MAVPKSVTQEEQIANAANEAVKNVVGRGKMTVEDVAKIIADYWNISGKKAGWIKKAGITRDEQTFYKFLEEVLKAGKMDKGEAKLVIEFLQVVSKYVSLKQVYEGKKTVEEVIRVAKEDQVIPLIKELKSKKALWIVALALIPILGYLAYKAFKKEPEQAPQMPDDSIVKLTKRIQEIQDQLDAAKKTIEDQQKKIDELNNQISELEAQLKKAKQSGKPVDITALQKEIDALKKKKGGLENENAEQALRIAQLERDLEAAKKRIAELEKQINEAKKPGEFKEAVIKHYASFVTGSDLSTMEMGDSVKRCGTLLDDYAKAEGTKESEEYKRKISMMIARFAEDTTDNKNNVFVIMMFLSPGTPVYLRNAKGEVQKDAKGEPIFVHPKEPGYMRSVYFKLAEVYKGVEVKTKEGKMPAVPK